MNLKFEITEKEKNFLYVFLKAVLLRTLIAVLSIAPAYLISWIGWVDKVNFSYLAGVMFVTFFNLGRDWQKHCL